MRKERLKIIISVGIILLVISVLTPDFSMGKIVEKNDITQEMYTTHDPIYIVGNDNFTSANGVVGGTGTKDDPYIIEGWDIDAKGGSYGIWIENTDAYFVIRNCKIWNATTDIGLATGIYLKKVYNGVIDNNTIYQNFYGIYVDSSSNNTITNNNCSMNRWSGIAQEDSKNITITNNTCFKNSGTGIGIHYSNNIIVINNNCSRNLKHGIYLDNSINNTLKENLLWGSGIYIWGSNPSYWNSHTIDKTNLVNGKPVYYFKNQNNGLIPSDAGQAILANCTNFTISGLTITNASAAIEVGFSSFNTITNNNCSGNSEDGLFLYSSNNNTIKNNECYKNSEGILLEHSNRNQIINNVCYYDDDGIHLWSSMNNTIIDNIFSENSDEGIFLDSSINNTIKNNTCSHNNDEGIYLVFSNNNTITNNTCLSNSGNGMELYSSGENHIRNNNYSENSYYGIGLSSSNNNTITYNNFYHNNKYGVYISSQSTNNTIILNNFVGNNGASKGLSGNCQTYDDSGGNYWYNESQQEGNYWSNWDGNNWGTPNAYPIDGGAGAYDKYPLSSPTVPEFSYETIALLVLVIVLATIITQEVQTRE